MLSFDDFVKDEYEHFLRMKEKYGEEYHEHEFVVFKYPVLRLRWALITGRPARNPVDPSWADGAFVVLPGTGALWAIEGRRRR